MNQPILEKKKKQIKQKEQGQRREVLMEQGQRRKVLIVEQKRQRRRKQKKLTKLQKTRKAAKPLFLLQHPLLRADCCSPRLPR